MGKGRTKLDDDELSVVRTNDGFIGWRWGTGDNVELVDLQVTGVPRTGGGRRLLVEMLRVLKDDPPYCTVFGFTRTSNLDAHQFYRAMGFDMTLVLGVYADGDAWVFSARYADLCARHLAEEYDLPCPIPT